MCLVLWSHVAVVRAGPPRPGTPWEGVSAQRGGIQPKGGLLQASDNQTALTFVTNTAHKVLFRSSYAVLCSSCAIS